MPNIDFYILSTDQETERLRFTCKLVEKIYRQQQQAYIQTETDRQSRQLDDLLWSFRAGSFIPHQLYTGSEPSPDNPILVAAIPVPKAWHNIVINLSTQFLEPPSTSPRLVEILDATETLKQAGRERYKHYKQCGYTIKIHNL